MSALMKESLRLFDNLLFDNMDVKPIFRLSLQEYDCLLYLKSNMNPKKLQAVDVSNNVEIVDLHLHKTHSLQKIPVIGFEPVECFLKDRRDGYDDYALFFHDTYSGIVIGVLLKPAVFERKDFKVADVNCRKLDSNVALKGRVALQMGSNELLITELVLKNMLTVLQPAEIVALLSALIFQQRTDSEPTLTPNLANGCEIMNKVHVELERLEQQYQLSTIPSLNFGLVEVVYEWAQAKSFAKIMKMTNVQEGIIVRCIQQLGETLRDVKKAAVTISDPILKEKMEEALTAIKREKMIKYFLLALLLWNMIILIQMWRRQK